MSDKKPSFLGSLGRALLYWREVTIVLPLSILAMIVVCLVILSVTGRPLLNDIGQLVDYMISVLKVVTWAAVTVQIQKSLFGYRTEAGTSGREDKKPLLNDDIYDSVVTFGVLILTGIAFAYWF